MTLTTYEQKLKAVDPLFHLKRTGRGLTAIWHGNNYICRTSSREITINDVVNREEAKMKDLEKGFNPLGVYSWNRLLERGRSNTARMLYDKKLIKHSDISKLTY